MNVAYSQSAELDAVSVDLLPTETEATVSITGDMSQYLIHLLSDQQQTLLALRNEQQQNFEALQNQVLALKASMVEEQKTGFTEMRAEYSILFITSI